MIPGIIRTSLCMSNLTSQFFSSLKIIEPAHCETGLTLWFTIVIETNGCSFLLISNFSDGIIMELKYGIFRLRMLGLVLFLGGLTKITRFVK